METYKVIFKAGETQGVYGISLVESPAMESQFIALASQEPLLLKAIDSEKRILLGAVLIPDKPVYRNQGGKEFNIVFPAETIRLTSENYHRQGYQNNSTLEHNEELKLSGVTFVESWIKEDMVNDKSAMHGFNEPIGTWFASMKVDSDEVWNDFVKTGKVKGFSIDGLFDLEKINLKSESNMNVTEIVDAIKQGFASISLKKETELKLGSIMTQDQSLKIEFEGDTIAKKMQVFLTAEDGTKMDVPDGEYVLEDGMSIVVLNSLVDDIKEPTPEDAPAVENAPAEMQSAPTVKSEKHTQEVFYQLAQEMGKQMEAMETRLMAHIESKKEVEVSLTKQKEVQEIAPRNAKERLQAKLNQTKK
jgi:hypothetical protein